MNTNVSSILQAAALLALLGTPARVLAQSGAAPSMPNAAPPMNTVYVPAPEHVDTGESTTRRQIKVEQRKFENYISDGENELRNAQYRSTASHYALAENNIILALVNLDVTFSLMSGHPGRVGVLKTSFFFSEKDEVKKFRANYEALRTRAYELQNKINEFIAHQLAPSGYTNALAAYMQNWSDQIRTSVSPENQAKEIFKQIQRAQDQQRGVTPGELSPKGPGGGSTSIRSLGGGFTFDPATGTVRDPQGNVIPGASWDPQGRRVHVGPYSFDPQNPAAVYDERGLAMPGMRFNPKTGQYERLDPGAGTWSALAPATPVGRLTASSAAGPSSRMGAGSEADMGSPSQAGMLPSSVGPTGAGAGGYDNSSGPGASDNIITASGRRLGWEEFRTYIDPATGRLKPDVVKTKYSDHQGGQITSETRFSVKLEKGSGPRDWVLNENPMDTIDWQFVVRPVGEQKKVADGFQATYELVNDTATPAEFEVTGWEGPDGRVYSTSERQFTFTFARPDQQTIKVNGITKKYCSKFAISLGTR